MKKKIIIIIIMLLVIFASAFAVSNRSKYIIRDTISNLEINSLANIELEIKADRRNCTINIQNKSDGNIVFDFTQRPMVIEIWQDDGWHEIVSTKYTIWPTEAVSKHSEYSFDIEWKDLIDGVLKPGKYRAIFYYGDQKVEVK